MIEDFWNEKETAAKLDKAPSTLQKMRVEGKGPPYVKLGGSVRYRPSDVMAWIESCRVTSTAQQPRAA